MIYHKSVLADLLTPVSAFLRISRDAERAFLLESVEGGEKIGRYSFIGVDPDQSFQGSFADFRCSFSEKRPSHPDLPPFTGGAVGAFCYEMVREFERLPELKGASSTELEAGSGPVLMDLYSEILAFDHLKHQIIILSHQGQKKVDELEERLLGSQGKSGTDTLFASRELGDSPESSPKKVTSSFSQEGFYAAVEKVKEYIRAGDVFQVVLSQRFETDFEGDPFNVYRALRVLNPSPYMFFLKLGDLSIAGSSPEMLIRVQGKDLQYRPIAGTRRRGRDAAEEEKLEEELLTDEKERAEHLMLVDLGRNDLGRVSQYGSVQVEGLMFVEKYSHVMHLVSALRGSLRPELNRFDALAACFPAGTVSGAPKVRAMEIIQELEPIRRGIYAGAIGYLDYSGNLDTCITIRTVVFKEGKAYLQAGAGIVADSVPSLEYKECYHKAEVLIRALELGEQLG
ncbi:MAG: anthranilate synthase component I [Acidobacteria bacterium]|nr:anthranilate synthase component I [Acidobacteriota bacterium]